VLLVAPGLMLRTLRRCTAPLGSSRATLTPPPPPPGAMTRRPCATFYRHAIDRFARCRVVAVGGGSPRRCTTCRTSALLAGERRRGIRPCGDGVRHRAGLLRRDGHPAVAGRDFTWEDIVTIAVVVVDGCRGSRGRLVVRSTSGSSSEPHPHATSRGDRRRRAGRRPRPAVPPLPRLRSLRAGSDLVVRSRGASPAWIRRSSARWRRWPGPVRGSFTDDYVAEATADTFTLSVFAAFACAAVAMIGCAA
jgi:hypothetical protein